MMKQRLTSFVQAVVSWVLSCQHECGGFGGSARNDPHMLYTLSAVQILELCGKLHLLDSSKVTQCKYMVLSLSYVCIGAGLVCSCVCACASVCVKMPSMPIQETWQEKEKLLGHA